jgi:hypothetical protein
MVSEKRSGARGHFIRSGLLCLVVEASPHSWGACLLIGQSKGLFNIHACRCQLRFSAVGSKAVPAIHQILQHPLPVKCCLPNPAQSS